MAADFPASVWELAGVAGQILGAATAATAGSWIAGRRERFGPAGTPITVSLMLVALFSLSVAAAPLGGGGQGLFEAAANLACLFAVYRLFGTDGRDASLAPIRPVIVALAFVELLHFGFEAIAPRLGLGGDAAQAAFQVTSLLPAAGGDRRPGAGAQPLCRRRAPGPAGAALAGARAGRVLGFRSQSLHHRLPRRRLAGRARIAARAGAGRLRRA